MHAWNSVSIPLAQREERDARMEFGDAYTSYEVNTPAFFPKLGVKAHA
jgi:protein-S-isoprenylcysteine O-methyltransferase Ste14